MPSVSERERRGESGERPKMRKSHRVEREVEDEKFKSIQENRQHCK